MDVPKELTKKDILKAELRDTNPIEYYIQQVFYSVLHDNLYQLNTEAGFEVTRKEIDDKLEQLAENLGVNIHFSEPEKSKTPPINIQAHYTTLVVVLRYKVVPTSEIKEIKAHISVAQ